MLVWPRDEESSAFEDRADETALAHVNAGRSDGVPDRAAAAFHGDRSCADRCSLFSSHLSIQLGPGAVLPLAAVSPG